MVQARAVIDLAQALEAHLEIARPALAARRHRAAGDDGARDHGARRDRRRHPVSRGPAVDVHRRGERGRKARLRADRSRGQPRLAQAAAGGAVRRAGHAEDQAHEDRVHDGRRRAGRAARADRSTRSSPTCCGTGTSRGSRRRSRACCKSVSDDGRIHTTYQQTVAATGRLSSTEPNLQNIPIRTDEGRLIRRAFIPGPDAELLLTADYSQIEMRIMATLSEDAGLIEAFRSGEDLHTFVAMRAFGLPAERGDPRDAPADQGHVLRTGVRAVRVRPVRTAEDLGGRGARADGGLLRAVRRRAGLPAAHGRPGRAGTATPRPSSAAAGTCPT